MESIILKGIASQLLQMSKPSYYELNKMLVECEVLQNVSGEFQYTGKEVYACIELAALLSKNNYKFETHEIVHYVLNTKSVTEALTKFITDKNLEESPQYGEFTLRFDAAMDYLKTGNSEAKVTYESATNGDYVRKSIYPGFTAWFDCDGLGNSKYYEFNQIVSGNRYHSDEKWAIVG